MASKAMGLNAEGIHFERQCEKQAFYLVKEPFFFFKKKGLQILIKRKKKSPNWLNLKFPAVSLLLQGLFLNLLPLK